MALITMPKEQAAEKWKEYLELEKQKSTKEFREFKQIYHQLSKGKAVLDLFETIKKVGVNADGEPRIAIAPANAPACWFRKIEQTQGRFQSSESLWRYSTPESIQVPKGTFPSWKRTENNDIIRSLIKAPRPSIPPEVSAKVGVSLRYPYYVLWEVEKWEPEPPRDPLLLRRVSNNIFVLIAKWNLTKLERAVMRGRI